MEKYNRICRICGEKLSYGSYSAYWLAEKNNSVCKKCASREKASRKCDLSLLLTETPEAYYWIGFLLADAHFQDGRIYLNLALKDKEQILKFGEFIKWTGKIINCKNAFIGMCPKHTEVVEELCEKFDIKHNKTYNPPKTILNKEKELLVYLLIGFIDGDGNIEHQYKRKDCFIRIKVHKSWEKIMEEFCQIIEYDTKHVRINKQGYCELYISDSKIVTRLKKLSKNVPALKRKWDKIDETYVSRITTSKIIREKIIKMLNEGMRNKDIAKQLKVSCPLVSKVKKLCQKK